VTRAKGRKEDMLRFVAGPGGELVPDIRARLPGRGVWVDGTRATVEQAIKRRVFAHGLKAAVSLPEALPSLIERLLVEDATQALAMANKSGAVIAGFAKVEAALRGGRVAMLVSAKEAAADSLRKLRASALAASRSGEETPHLLSLASSEMSLALGRENVIHLAVLAGAAGAAFISKCRRLDRFRAGKVEIGGPDADRQSVSTGPFVLSDRQDAELDE
jgi:predicted RNA-binding protein YlxR (DUF448 family)